MPIMATIAAMAMVISSSIMREAGLRGFSASIHAARLDAYPYAKLTGSELAAGTVTQFAEPAWPRW